MQSKPCVSLPSFHGKVGFDPPGEYTSTLSSTFLPSRARASGEEIDIHGTMIAMKEAELSLRLATTMRDKFVEAYNKIINLQI